MQRLPFVAVIAVAAIIGAVGGIIVLSAGPKTVGIIDDLVTGIVAVVRGHEFSLFTTVNKRRLCSDPSRLVQVVSCAG